MAKKSAIEKNHRRRRLVERFAAKRAELRKVTRIERASPRNASRRRWRWPSCRATAPGSGCATGAS